MLAVITTGKFPKSLTGGGKVRKSKKLKESNPKPTIKSRDVNLALKSTQRKAKPKKEK